MYDIRSAMLNIGIVFTPGKFKINLEKTWKTPGILVNLRSTDPEYVHVLELRIGVHISTQKPPNVGSSSAISEPIIAGLVSARGLPNPMKLGNQLHRPTQTG